MEFIILCWACLYLSDCLISRWSNFSLKKLEQQHHLDNRKKQMQIDERLDASELGCYFYGDTLAYLNALISENDGIVYDLVSFCVMPNHVHLLFRPLEMVVSDYEKD